MSLVIVPTGTANVASVRAAFHRLGEEPTDAVGPDDVAGADGVVLPGVGSFGAAIAAIDELELRQPLIARVESGAPTLCVCVGMQLLATQSAESPGARGLGVIGQRVTRFDDTVRVPQLGWNRVEPAQGSIFITPGWAYFANSYRMESGADGWMASTSSYGGSFVAGLERGRLLALQFHPELSGEWGSQVLSRWLEGAS